MKKNSIYLGKFCSGWKWFYYRQDLPQVCFEFLGNKALNHKQNAFFGCFINVKNFSLFFLCFLYLSSCVFYLKNKKNQFEILRRNGTVFFVTVPLNFKYAIFSLLFSFFQIIKKQKMAWVRSVHMGDPWLVI